MRQKQKITGKRRKGAIAISEIILLIFGTIAFAYVLGSGFSVVGAYDTSSSSSALCDASYDIRPTDETRYVYKCGDPYKYDFCNLETGGKGSGWDACSKNVKAHLVYDKCCKEKESSSPSTEQPPPITTVPTNVIGNFFLRKIGGEAFEKFKFSLKGGSKGTPAPPTPPDTPPTPLTPPDTPTLPSFLDKYLFGKGTTGATANALKAGAVVAVIVVAYTFVSTFHKTGDYARAAEAAGRVAIGAGVGIGVYSALVALTPLGPAGWIASAFVILGVWASKFLKRAEDRQITFTCKPWQAQSGGTNCELCNNQNFPCTEYQCKSFGAGCEIINKDTDEPRCVWKDPRDVNAPVIQAWKDALTSGYTYKPLPPAEGTGVEVKYGNAECLPAFQPFTFGVELDKDGYCKIESKRTNDFSEMQFDFGGENIYRKQHSHTMTFPGVVHLEKEIAEKALNITVDSENAFYVRCEAATNGKSNRDEFIFKFCIDKGPDTTSPEIRGFNWIDNAPIAYFGENETREVDVQVYVNEPAQCKWGWEDKSYENMENNLTCPNSLINFNAQLSYTCYGKLTGIENGRENKFFFRCNDTFGNVNIQSKRLSLIGTQSLFISKVEPNATTIKNATDTIKITLKAETSAGYRQGEAACYYSNTGAPGSYVLFSGTNSHRHSTNVWLNAGDYNFFIRCADLAGNSDTKEISFTVETDTFAPIVVRVFHEGQSLKIITDEKAICVYDNRDCLYDFEDGIAMTSDEKVHSTAWNIDKNFYIKCQDEFENKPLPQSCSIIARPFEI